MVTACRGGRWQGPAAGCNTACKAGCQGERGRQSARVAGGGGVPSRTHAASSAATCNCSLIRTDKVIAAPPGPYAPCSRPARSRRPTMPPLWRALVLCGLLAALSGVADAAYKGVKPCINCPTVYVPMIPCPGCKWWKSTRTKSLCYCVKGSVCSAKKLQRWEDVSAARGVVGRAWAAARPQHASSNTLDQGGGEEEPQAVGCAAGSEGVACGSGEG